MLLVFVGSNAQTANQLIREGNKLFSSKNYAQAEILYHKAIDKDGSNAIANYNWVDAYKHKKRMRSKEISMIMLQS